MEPISALAIIAPAFTAATAILAAIMHRAERAAESIIDYRAPRVGE